MENKAEKERKERTKGCIRKERHAGKDAGEEKGRVGGEGREKRGEKVA